MGETTQDQPVIASLEDVRPGDLIFTEISEPLAASILVKLGMLALAERVRIGRRSFDHVIVVTEASHRGPAAGDHTYVAGPVRPRLDEYRAPVGVQAMPRGCERVELTVAKHWTDRTAVVRIPETYPGQALDAAEIAKAFAAERVAYSFASYVMLAAWRLGMKTPRLERRINRRRPPLRVFLPGRQYAISVRLPVEAICSVVGDQVWTLTGKGVVTGVAPQAVTPGRLVMSLWRYPGAVWGGRGILG